MSKENLSEQAKDPRKIVDYSPLLNNAVGKFVFANKKELREVIRPSEMQDLHPHKKGLSLLDVDSKEDLRGNFAGNFLEIKKILKLSELLYGDLFSEEKEAEESREKFSEYIKAGLELFKKASHGYFEKKEGFKDFENKLRENFIDKVPSSENIKSLFFAGNNNSIFKTEEEMVWARSILQSSLPATYRAESPESWENLEEAQGNFMGILKEFVDGKKFKGIQGVEVIELKGQEKNPIRIDQKHITKPDLKKEDIPDAVRGRYVLKVKEGFDKKKVLQQVSEKIFNKLKRSKKKYKISRISFEDPGDSSRTEFKIEGIINNKTFEISIFDNEAYELDEKYGPYAHEIYELVKGDAIYLARLGMLEKGWVEKRVHELAKLKTWQDIPARVYQKISQDFLEIIRKKGAPVIKIVTTRKPNGEKNTEKFYTITESTAAAIIRSRLRKLGFRFDKKKNRYFLIEQAINKLPLAVNPDVVYELERIAREIKDVVNKNISKKQQIDLNTAMGIIKGNLYAVNEEVFEIIEREMGLKFEKAKKN